LSETDQRIGCGLGPLYAHSYIYSSLYVQSRITGCYEKSLRVKASCSSSNFRTI